MAYDEALAGRLRAHLAGHPGLTEQKMFGGLAFLVDGHLAVAASGQGGLLLRCDPADTDAWVAERGLERFEMRGKAMDGWLAVDPSAVDTEAALERFLEIGLASVAALLPK
jgi:hypothetical protein